MVNDYFFDGRFLVSGRIGHLRLGFPISLTQTIQNIVIPNIPALAVLPYTFRNGLTETVGTPSIVELGGTLLNDTFITGLAYELQFEVGKLTNIAENYSLTTADCNIDISASYNMRNSVFNADCGLYFYTQAQLDMPVLIDGNIPATADGSKMTIEGVIGSDQIGSGYYNLIDDACTPYSTMQQSFINNGTGAYGSSAVTVNGGVEIKYENNDGVADVYTSINLEGSVSIEAGDNDNALYQRIVVTNDEAPTFSGINDVTTDPYSYTFPNTTPNNGDIMIADGAGKLQYEPNEIHIAAFNKITGVVGQLALFPVPFILNHVCTRIAFIAEAATNAGNISVDVVDVQSANNVLESAVIPISNAISHWSGSVDLTGLVMTDIPRQLGVLITANTQGTPALTSLYLSLTFVRQI